MLTRLDKIIENIMSSQNIKENAGHENMQPQKFIYTYLIIKDMMKWKNYNGNLILKTNEKV